MSYIVSALNISLTRELRSPDPSSVVLKPVMVKCMTRFFTIKIGEVIGIFRSFFSSNSKPAMVRGVTIFATMSACRVISGSKCKITRSRLI